MTPGQCTSIDAEAQLGPSDWPAPLARQIVALDAQSWVYFGWDDPRAFCWYAALPFAPSGHGRDDVVARV